MPITSGEKIAQPSAGVIGVVNEIRYHLRLVTTTSGTVDTTANTGTWTPGGVTLIKTPAKTGRYTVTLPCAYERLLNVIITPFGPDDAAWGASTTGVQAFTRDDDVSRTKYRAASASDGTVEIQFQRTDTNADAEIPDGAGAYITIFVARGDAS